MGRPQSKGRRRRSDRVRGPKIEGTDPTAISRKVGTNQQGISNPETGRIKNGNDLLQAREAEEQAQRARNDLDRQPWLWISRGWRGLLRRRPQSDDG